MSSPEEEQPFIDKYPFGLAMVAIDGLDTATRHYLIACEEYASKPSDIQKKAVIEMANLHAQAFRIAAIALNSDDIDAEEYRDILAGLLLEQDEARVTTLSTALIVEIGEEALEGMCIDRTEDDPIDSRADQRRLKKIFQENCARCHSQCLGYDTQVFIDTIAEAA